MLLNHLWILTLVIQHPETATVHHLAWPLSRHVHARGLLQRLLTLACMRWPAGAQRLSLASRPSSPALSQHSVASMPVGTEAARLKRQMTDAAVESWQSAGSDQWPPKGAEQNPSRRLQAGAGSSLEQNGHDSTAVQPGSMSRSLSAFSAGAAEGGDADKAAQDKVLQEAGLKPKSDEQPVVGAHPICKAEHALPAFWCWTLQLVRAFAHPWVKAISSFTGRVRLEQTDLQANGRLLLISAQ